MPSIVGPGASYSWRDGSISSLAPPSDALDIILAQPTRWAVENGTTISYDRIYREQATVGGACRFLAGQVARLPLKTFLRVDENDKPTEDGSGRTIRDRGSAFAKALRRPAPGRSRHSLKRDIALDLYVNGNHLEEIVKVRYGFELRRIFWRQARPNYNEARTEILGWWVHDQGPAGKPRYLDTRNVLHFAFGATDLPLGVSPLEQLGVALQIDRAASAHQLATLKNGARVGTVIVIDPQYAGDAELVESVRTEFMAKQAGVQNANKPFVAAGVDVKTLPQHTMIEAALLEQRKVSREEVSAVLQLATVFLGDMSQATQNNFGEAYKQLFKTTLADVLDLIPETFEAQLVAQHPLLVPSDSSYCEFDINAILFGDPAERAKAYQGLMDVGGITVNEVRDLENRERYPYAWCDLPVLKVNNVQAVGEEFPEPKSPVLNSAGGTDPTPPPAES